MTQQELNLTLRNGDLKGLVELLREQKLRKRDIVAPSNLCEMQNGNFVIHDLEASDNLKNLLKVAQVSQYEAKEDLKLAPMNIFHEGIGDKLKINRDYYKKIVDELPLLDYNVNYWLRKAEKNYLIRTFTNPDGEGGIARAFLSDSYRPIDNFDVLITVLEEIKNHPEIEIGKCDLTEEKMYVQFINRSFEIEAPELLKNYRRPNRGNHEIYSEDSGFGVFTGFTISNSEVGRGSYCVTPRGVIKVCNNGLIVKKDQLRKIHIGGRLDEGVIEWSEDTVNKSMELVQLQTRDAIKTFLSREYLQGVIDFMEQKGTKKLEKPIDATKNVCKELKLGEDKINKVLSYFIEGGDNTPFGIAQAVTFFAQETETADQQYFLEEKVMELVPVISDRFDK